MKILLIIHLKFESILWILFMIIIFIIFMWWFKNLYLYLKSNESSNEINNRKS